MSQTTTSRPAPGSAPPAAGPFRRELIRKSMHSAAGLAAAALLAFAPPALARAVLVAAVVVALLVEAARLRHPGVRAAFGRTVGALLRPRERARPTGATTLAIGFAATALLFPPPYALAGVLVAGVADAAGAVIGQRWGRHRYPNGKSVEGSVAFVACALPVMLLVPGAGWMAATGAAIVVALLEAAPLRAPDNVLVPLTAAGAAWLAALVA